MCEDRPALNGNTFARSSPAASSVAEAASLSVASCLGTNAIFGEDGASGFYASLREDAIRLVLCSFDSFGLGVYIATIPLHLN